MKWNAKWIAPKVPMGEVCPEFFKGFDCGKPVRKAVLHVTAMGVYEMTLNGSRVSDYVLAPGWTVFEKRHQYQEYDVTDLVKENNDLRILVGRGWYRGPWEGWYRGPWEVIKPSLPAGLIAQLELTYADGTTEWVVTDESWQVRESIVRYSDIYHGETADATVNDALLQPVILLDKGVDTLIPQEGEIIREQERIRPRRIFKTPKGETVVDFGQEIAGYVELTLDAKTGDQVEISHAEVLDKEGNFYNENYRTAKAKLCYTCREGVQN